MTQETPAFIQQFNGIMKGIASPAYLFFPFLERLLPRPRVHAGIASFRAAFQAIIDAKRHDKGTDLVSY
jgi:cytochrome P450